MYYMYSIKLFGTLYPSEHLGMVATKITEINADHPVLDHPVPAHCTQK